MQKNSLGKRCFSFPQYIFVGYTSAILQETYHLIMTIRMMCSLLNDSIVKLTS